MPEPIKSGADVTDLFKDLKSGDDVTSLMSGSDVTNLMGAEPSSEFNPIKELVRSGYEKMMKPLLPEADTSGTESYIGANIPGINSIWPGGIRIPRVSEIYNELIRPLSAPIGLLTAGLEGAIGAKGAFKSPGELAPIEAETPVVLERPKPKLLNAAPREIERPARFIAGQAGVAENRPYLSKIGNIVPPDLLARHGENVGTGELTRSTALGNSFDPAVIAEQDRLARLGYTVQNPGEALQLPNDSLPIPPESGDTRLGFNAQSQGDLPYPLNVVPNLVRPRTIQSNMASETQMPILDRLGEQPRSNPIRELEPIGNYTNKENQVSTIGPNGELTRYNLKSDEPYAQPSAPIKQNRFFGPESKAPLDEINLEPKPDAIRTPEETVIPQPGQAKPVKDISGFTANFTSPDITLASRSITKPIADVIVKAQDQKMNWIASTERELSDLSKGLGKSDRIQLGQLIDGQDIPNASPELRLRSQQARTILDSVHEMFPEGATRAGEDVGYLENYFTHIHHQPEDISSAINSIIDHHFGIFKSPQDLADVEGTSTGDLYEKGLGKPGSPYVEPRQNNARTIQYDVNKVFPAYIESAAKVIFDKPAVEAAKAQLAKIPDSNLKELATWYIKNYSNYDSLPGLHKAWNSWASTIARTTSRSLLGFNTGLQTLHLARIPANMWPELGTKYSSIGLKEVATHPIQAWTEAAKLGLLQNEIRPMSFKTPLEKFDSLSNFLSLADYLDKAIGYHGYKRMMLDQGSSAEQASLDALKFTKRVSQTTDAARQMKGMSSESNVMGGEVASRLGWQFKQVPAKIVEQYMNIAKGMKDNPQAATRMVAGVGLALAANEGLRTFHLDPYHMIPSGAWGAFGTTVTKVANSLSKGNWEKALMDSALWAIPGGQSLKRQIESGPSALNP
jgi:hypothetical protein